MKRGQKQHNKIGKRPVKRRGTIVVLVALMIIAFLASVAFSVDVAYMQLTKMKLRSATDAAARAAGEGLSRQQDIDYARQAAKDIAAAHHVAGKPLMLDDADIVFGNTAQQPSGAFEFTANTQPINAVRVHGKRTRDSLSGSVPIFFGRVLNVFDFQPTQLATVVRLERDICLVLDRSSSMKLYLTDTAESMSPSDPRFCQPPEMAQSRWGALSVALQRFVDALDTTQAIEYVGLVSYASDYNGCSYSNNAADINAQLSESTAVVTTAMQGISDSKFNGGTDIASGILKGIEVMTNESYARPFAAKTMVVMTDGHYSYWMGHEAPSTVAPQAAAEDIIIHTITFGAGAGQAEMQSVAEITGGNHYHAPDAQALQDIFEEIALTLPVMFTD